MAHPALSRMDKYYGRDDVAEAIENAYQRGHENALAEQTNTDALRVIIEDSVIGDALCLVDMDALRGELLTGWICAASRLTRAMQQAAADADKVRVDRVAAVNAEAKGL